MKRLIFLGCLCMATLFLGSSDVIAQETAVNGDFETAAFAPMWSLFGGNKYIKVVSFQTVAGKPSLCLKRKPGKPDNNGGIEQKVFLVKGYTYNFHADIAAVESG